MEDRETARMRKHGESKTTRIMVATVPHVTSGLGLRKFQADGFLLTRVYLSEYLSLYLIVPRAAIVRRTGSVAKCDGWFRNVRPSFRREQFSSHWRDLLKMLYGECLLEMWLPDYSLVVM